jgi:hypothetical protein
MKGRLFFLLALLVLISPVGAASKGDTFDKRIRKLGVTSLTVAEKGDISIAKIRMKKSPAQAAEGDAAKLLRACYEVALEQKAKYFVVLLQEEGKKPITTVGYTNRAKPNVPAEFGSQYTTLDKAGKPRTIFSVDEIASTLPK